MAKTNLIHPGYRPEYTGDDGLGNIGSGTRLGAHLYYLYRAGRNELPAVAAVYADLTQRIHLLADAMRALFDQQGASLERARAYLRLLDLRAEAHDVLRTTCLRLLEVSEALVGIADSYAVTDRVAANELTRLLDENAADYQVPPRVPVPPAVGDPPPVLPPRMTP